MASTEGDPGVMALLVSAGDVDDKEEDKDACKQGASKAQQDSIQEGQSYIQRPLLVQRDRCPLHDQVQVMPCQIPYYHTHTHAKHITSQRTVGAFLSSSNLNEEPGRQKQKKNGQVIITFLNFCVSWEICRI